MIWFDVTEIKNWQGHYTGIQRVISKLGQQLQQNENVRLCYYDPLINGFREYDFDFNDEVTYDDQTKNVKATINTKIQKAISHLKHKAPPRLKNQIKRVVAIKGIHHEVIDFDKGDVLFIPGAFWIYSFDHLVALKEEREIKVVGVMYDLVPLVTPQFTAQVTIEGFGAHFERAINLFDHWFAISNNTKSDMLRIAKDRNIQINPSQVEVIRLGVDNPKVDGDHRPVGGLTAGKFALFVSTIEARKNQALVYQAVKRLKERSLDHHPVVLAGKHGWLSDDIIYILKHDQTIADKLIWLDRVDDRSLRWLYANCSFTVYPSYYEGWGLPVAESLAMGKPCIASNASSIPEVAGDLIEYFSPYSSDELSELIVKYSTKKYLDQRTKIIKKFESPSWKKCGDQVLSVLLSQ